MTVGQLKRVVSWLWHNEYNNGWRLKLDAIVDLSGSHPKTLVPSKYVTEGVEKEVFRCELLGANEDRHSEVIKVAIQSISEWNKVFSVMYDYSIFAKRPVASDRGVICSELRVLGYLIKVRLKDESSLRIQFIHSSKSKNEHITLQIKDRDQIKTKASEVIRRKIKKEL